jgi:hypothetical protein
MCNKIFCVGMPWSKFGTSRWAVTLSSTTDFLYYYFACYSFTTLSDGHFKYAATFRKEKVQEGVHGG